MACRLGAQSLRMHKLYGPGSRQPGCQIWNPKQVEEGWPQPDRDAGSLRLDSIFRILLGEGYSITYGTTSRFSYTQPLYQTQMR